MDPPDPHRLNETQPPDETGLRRSHPALRNAAITIGPGWYGLVLNLFAQLPRDVIVSRIKETDGELQVLLIGSADGSDEAIWCAAELSRYTCSVCGEPGEVVARRGSVKAVCERHAASWTRDAAMPG